MPLHSYDVKQDETPTDLMESDPMENSEFLISFSIKPILKSIYSIQINHINN